MTEARRYSPGVADLTPRTLLLLRHCRPADAAPGGHDRDRPLTAAGRAQARAVGDHLRSQGLAVDHVLCSPAVRTRQTLADLDLDADVDVQLPEQLYTAGGDTIVQLIRELPDVARVALVLGHAPGLPAVAYDLADPTTSAPDAAAAIESRFPAGTLAVLRVDGAWADLAAVSLAAVRLP